jgi:hypothetical protein
MSRGSGRGERGRGGARLRKDGEIPICESGGWRSARALREREVRNVCGELKDGADKCEAG